MFAKGVKNTCEHNYYKFYPKSMDRDVSDDVIMTSSHGVPTWPHHIIHIKFGWDPTWIVTSTVENMKNDDFQVEINGPERLWSPNRKIQW